MRSKLNSWIDAFDHLLRLLRIDHKEGMKVVFLDEMPWFLYSRHNESVGEN